MQYDLQYDLLQDQENRSPETYELGSHASQIARRVMLRGGDSVVSVVNVEDPRCGDDLHASFDAAWLRMKSKPEQSASRGSIRLVDLFCGCGALSLGVQEACRAVGLSVDHVFAADINPNALDVYQKNFSPEQVSREPVESVVQSVDSAISSAERKLKRSLGDIDLLAAGPPCQGHSDLNNHTRRNDPRNALFESVIRFAQVLEPRNIIIENVPGVRHDTQKVTTVSLRALASMGYHLTEEVLTASEFGVPQRRRRYILVATRDFGFRFSSLARVDTERSLRWACEDLLHTSSNAVIDTHARSSFANRKRIEYLFEHDLHDLPDDVRPECHRSKKHSYRAVYGRLTWDEPAPTITSGFNSPGQGRFVHPEAPRTLTPHEAARLQFLPDFFKWGDTSREGLTHMIGNAVPPKLAYAVALELLR